MTIPRADAVTKKQIMRDLGVLPRSMAKLKIKKIKTDRISTSNHKGFRIHQNFVCGIKNIISSNNFDIQQVSEASFIDIEKLENPITFSLAIEIIKAYLQSTLELYKKNGIDFDIQRYNVRFHSDDELYAYPDDVALEPEEQGKIYYPDTLRSAAYTYYVILPIIRPLMSKTYYADLNDLLSEASFNKVLRNRKKRTIWYYKDYEALIFRIYTVLDKIEAEFLSQFSLSRENQELQINIILALMNNNWISYLAVRSCDMISVPIDPYYDFNYYYEPTPTRDNYLLGLGLFKRSKLLIQKYIFNQKAIRQNNNFYSLKEYLDFFDGFYQNLEPPFKDKITDAEIKKLHTYSINSIKNMR